MSAVQYTVNRTTTVPVQEAWFHLSQLVVQVAEDFYRKHSALAISPLLTQKHAAVYIDGEIHNACLVDIFD